MSAEIYISTSVLLVNRYNGKFNTRKCNVEKCTQSVNTSMGEHSYGKKMSQSSKYLLVQRGNPARLYIV